jgi:hypothetical protein
VEILRRWCESLLQLRTYQNVSSYAFSNEVCRGLFSHSVNVAHSQGTARSDPQPFARRGWGPWGDEAVVREVNVSHSPRLNLLER